MAIAIVVILLAVGSLVTHVLLPPLAVFFLIAVMAFEGGHIYNNNRGVLVASRLHSAITALDPC